MVHPSRWCTITVMKPDIVLIHLCVISTKKEGIFLNWPRSRLVLGSNVDTSEWNVRLSTVGNLALHSKSVTFLEIYFMCGINFIYSCSLSLSEAYAFKPREGQCVAHDLSESLHLLIYINKRWWHATVLGPWTPSSKDWFLLYRCAKSDVPELAHSTGRLDPPHHNSELGILLH
jgi:hypothetical protein